MFGYVNVNRAELSIENRNIYQSYYCGLCQCLKKKYGKKGQMLLNYDITFLTLLLTGLYEPEEEKESFRCALHPTKKRGVTKSQITSYAADMNVLLAYHNLMDDYEDGHSLVKKSLANRLLPEYKKLSIRYPRQTRAIEDYMLRLHECEKTNEENIDLVAGLTGDMLGELFAMREDEWYEDLKALGHHLGKFIYLMDAYEDVDRDIKSGNYNPFKKIRLDETQDFETIARLMMQSMMSECAKTFERMPIILHAEIIRNVLYSGIWSKYEYIQLKKKKEIART